ncbi:hypothetical protein [Vampirovibrio chlorellavorus]|uniref:hypothetical protein n=1 Tax=Vampirovibrio chlorellavorus TaxID=758823 RepID=UPI0026EA102E|nr:hypothetical protein [Vampirovibrio chlorellavorus]
MKAIIEVTGQPGSGKTSVVISLGEELTPASVLYIDASPDRQLTEALAPTLPELTLGRLVSEHSAAAPSREAVDWVFQDLTVSVGEEQELLTVGELPLTLSEIQLQKLQYGLTRLIENYDYVILDGHHPVLHGLLPEETLQLLDIVIPRDFSGWRLTNGRAFVRTPALILNQYGNQDLPASLEEALQAQQIQLIGKLPHYPSEEERARQFSTAFGDCLLRLNIPLHPHAH